MNEAQRLMLEYYELWNRMDAVYERWAKDHGLSYTELLILYTLWEVNQEITQRDLCREWHLPKQTVNSLLHALAKRQIVDFKESAQDHRQRIILLTPQGKALAGEVIKELQAHEMHVMRKMGTEAMKTMLKETRRFLDAFEEADNDENVL